STNHSIAFSNRNRL
ncbi:hypothetical protein cmbei_7005530, partial [Cryptosporidium meleagridis]